MSPEHAALAATRIADENMANAIRLISVERGLDPRDFALMAFGGAGPLHARAVAERLGMSTVLIPLQPGLCSALGCMIAEARVDRVKTHHARSDWVNIPELARAASALRVEAVEELHKSVGPLDAHIARSADLRYVGQNHELEVDLGEVELDEAGWGELLHRFETEHNRKFGFALPGTPIELVNLRVTALHPRTPPAFGDRRAPANTPQSVARPVWFDTDGAVDCFVYRRESLAVGTVVVGPAIIEEGDSTTLAFPGDRIEVHESGVLVLTLRSAE
jgi:N-methylhydantoinase A